MSPISQTSSRGGKADRKGGGDRILVDSSQAGVSHALFPVFWYEGSPT